MGNTASASCGQTSAIKSETTEDGPSVEAHPSSSESKNANGFHENQGSSDPQIILIDCGKCKGAIEVEPSMTLVDLYQKIVDDFDEEMIPGGGTVGEDGDFSFRIWVQGVQPTKKQSQRFTVSEIIRRKWNIQLVENKMRRKEASPKPTAPPAPSVECVVDDNGNGKRPRENRDESNPNNQDNPNKVNETESSPEEGKNHEHQTTSSNSPSKSRVTPFASSPISHDSNPSPLKRSRIFPNSESTEETMNSNKNTSVESDNTSVVVSPLPLARTEVGRQELQGESKNEQEQKTEKERQQTQTCDESEGKQIKVSTTSNENPTNDDDFGTMDCDDGDGDDDATVPMSLSPSSDSGQAPSIQFDDDASANGKDQAVKDDKQSSTAISKNDDLHAKYDLALQKSCRTLMELEKMLLDNKPNPNDGGVSFCSEARNEEWRKGIKEHLSKGTAGPKTVVGVLGSTGVGKSSLLNALLDEAAVLPTSGSRGCTAAVVELTYNRDLLQDPIGSMGSPSANPVPAKKVPVYKGKVEFMKLEDWKSELKFLVDECSTQEKKIYIRCPEEQNQPDAAAAWAKIDQVYGKGTMANFSGRPTASVFDRLSTNTRVVKLLTPKSDSQEPYNAVYVEEGSINLSDAANTVLCEYNKMDLRTRRQLKRWAKSFRSKINDYVYRKGNGSEAQTWPLIRCVSLQGPWNVLSSGGVLVDLPGVRDANAARARVSERYLQNCNQIWVVAPIKRAVDDGTAKELMGEQFKRRLLMDGQYGNIAFICTQTDDCEATEIMRDHEDVAVRVAGRWEEMTKLQEEINGFETQLSDLQQQQEDLNFAVDEATEHLNEITSELDDAKNPSREKQSVADNDDDDDDEEFLPEEINAKSEKVLVREIDKSLIQELEVQVSNQKKAVETATRALSSWRKTHNGQKTILTTKCARRQRKLKAICAKVRNEYSTKCLQEDFITGLKEIYRDANESSRDEENEIAIPPDVSLPVFCISANDYLKVTGIKPSSDGPPNCFSLAIDTQIQRLREFVHETTASRRVSFTESFVNRASDIVDRIKLLANDSKSDGGSTRQKVRCKDLFDEEIKNLSNQLGPIANDFESEAKKKIMRTLKPSLASGASKARSSAMSTVVSWGSRHRRTKYERSQERNGLYWSTYFATARRSGVYVSASAGAVDFNAELVEPMEAEFTPAWQSIMDGAFRHLLSASQRQVIDLCKQLDRTLLGGLVSIGIDKERVTSMVSISSSNCTTAVRTCFEDMLGETTENQRELNRSLLPKVQESMKQSYYATINVPAGGGKFERMKSAMNSYSSRAVNGVFDECTHDLLAAIEHMVENLRERIDLLQETIKTSLFSVYSILWEDQNGGKVFDPVYQKKVLACRAACLPILTRLQEQQDEVRKVLGIERPILDLEIAGVETWEEKNEKKMQAAKQSGNFIDLVDDSDEVEGTMGNSGNPSMKKNASSNFATINHIKREMPTSISFSGSDTMNRKTGLSNSLERHSIDADAGFYVNKNLYCRTDAVFAQFLQLSVAKVSQGFFVESIGKNTKFNKGKMFPGDIITFVSGKPVKGMGLDEFKRALEAENLTVWLCRSVIEANAGSLGLIVVKVPEGFEISDIGHNSQLKAFVKKGDILTAIDGTRLSKLNTYEFEQELARSKHHQTRHIWILRKDSSMNTGQCGKNDGVPEVV